MQWLRLIETTQHHDHRGSFAETYNFQRLKSIGINDRFVQDNQSSSKQMFTLRGLHFQSPPHAQAKLVRCLSGSIYDVAVDIRVGSPFFGAWVGVELNSHEGRQMYIPHGFAHGFVTLEPDTIVMYKCSEYYAPEAECVIRWDDPLIGVNWALDGEPILNDRDANAPFLKDMVSPFKFGD